MICIVLLLFCSVVYAQSAQILKVPIQSVKEREYTLFCVTNFIGYGKAGKGPDR